MESVGLFLLGSFAAGTYKVVVSLELTTRSKQTRHSEQLLALCCANVADVGTTLMQHWFIVLSG